MGAMQAELWIGAGACLVLGVIALLGELRRRRRRDFDSVGFMPWQTVQFLALTGALVLAYAAMH